jgi:hypothetical protein
LVLGRCRSFPVAPGIGGNNDLLTVTRISIAKNGPRIDASYQQDQKCRHFRLCETNCAFITQAIAISVICPWTTKTLQRFTTTDCAFKLVIKRRFVG